MRNIYDLDNSTPSTGRMWFEAIVSLAMIVAMLLAMLLVLPDYAPHHVQADGVPKPVIVSR